MRKIVLALSALAVFGLSFLGYAISYGSINVTPDQEEIIASDKPVISVDWPYAVGASLKSAKVYLDGKDISEEISVHSKGFSYRVPKNLPQGIHVINAKLRYNIIYEKKVNLKWFFSTDTIPPRIVMNERKNTLASRTPNLGLKAQTEPLSQIEAQFNKEKKTFTESNAKGRFVIGLKGLRKNNKLVLVAKDRAGNVTKRNLAVIIDTKAPQIKPSSANLIFAAESKHQLRALLKDGESGVFKARMLLNGQPVKAKHDLKKDVIAHLDPLTKDGRYEAQVDAWDVAGNKTTKKWIFVVDTSHIIIDQSDFRLNLYKGDKVIHTVNVAVGRPGYPTPNGHWKVVNKKSMPAWYNPHAGWSAGMPAVIPPGPSNPLGLRAMYLNASGIRIHGTASYYSIGSRASHGCIRVRNADILGLFPKVRVGTPVLIRP